MADSQLHSHILCKRQVGVAKWSIQHGLDNAQRGRRYHGCRYGLPDVNTAACLIYVRIRPPSSLSLATQRRFSSPTPARHAVDIFTPGDGVEPLSLHHQDSRIATHLHRPTHARSFITQPPACLQQGEQRPRQPSSDANCSDEPGRILGSSPSLAYICSAVWRWKKKRSALDTRSSSDERFAARMAFFALSSNSARQRTATLDRYTRGFYARAHTCYASPSASAPRARSTWHGHTDATPQSRMTRASHQWIIHATNTTNFE